MWQAGTDQGGARLDGADEGKSRTDWGYSQTYKLTHKDSSNTTHVIVHPIVVVVCSPPSAVNWFVGLSSDCAAVLVKNTEPEMLLRVYPFPSMANAPPYTPALHCMIACCVCM